MHGIVFNAGIWGQWPQVLGAAAGVFAVSAHVGLPFTAFRALVLAVREESSRYAHLARQLLMPTLFGSWICTLLCAAALFAPGVKEWASPFPILHLRIMGGTCLSAALLNTLLSMCWKRHPGTRPILNLLIGLCLLTALLAGLCGALKLVFPEYMRDLAVAVMSGTLPPVQGRDSLFSLLRVLFPVFTVLTVLALTYSAGASAAMPWLLLRRSIDDFGRDYYAFALRRCARRGTKGCLLLALPWLGLILVALGLSTLAAYGTLPTFLLAGGADEPGNPTMPFDITDTASAVLALLTAALPYLLMRHVLKAEMPMRSKIAIWTAPLLMILALTCAGMLMSTLLPQLG